MESTYYLIAHIERNTRFMNKTTARWKSSMVPYQKNVKIWLLYPFYYWNNAEKYEQINFC